jgi:hypothetical protein
VVATLALGVMPAAAQPRENPAVESLLGTWRGTSTCTDKVAAPACQDETVIYDVRRGDKPGHAILAAHKIVNDQRVPMGELDFAWDAAEACWRSDFASPRVTSRWCLVVAGDRLTGTARLLPGNQVIRRVQANREIAKSEIIERSHQGLPSGRSSPECR